MVGWQVGGGSQGPAPRHTAHLALPATRAAGVTVPHPHAPEGIVGNFPLVPDAGEEQSVRLGWGRPPPHVARSHLPSLPSSPEDPAVGIPAEGLLVLGHVVERAELVLIPGGTATVRGVPAPSPATPALTHVDSTRLKHLPESRERCAGPGRGEGDTESSARADVRERRPGRKRTPHKTGAVWGKSWFEL